MYSPPPVSNSDYNSISSNPLQNETNSVLNNYEPFQYKTFYPREIREQIKEVNPQLLEQIVDKIKMPQHKKHQKAKGQMNLLGTAQENIIEEYLRQRNLQKSREGSVASGSNKGSPTLSPFPNSPREQTKQIFFEQNSKQEQPKEEYTESEEFQMLIEEEEPKFQQRNIQNLNQNQNQAGIQFQIKNNILATPYSQQQQQLLQQQQQQQYQQQHQQQQLLLLQQQLQLQHQQQLEQQQYVYNNQGIFNNYSEQNILNQPQFVFQQNYQQQYIDEENRNHPNIPEDDVRESSNSLGQLKTRKSIKGNNINPEELPGTTDNMVGGSMDEEFERRNSHNKQYFK